MQLTTDATPIELAEEYRKVLLDSRLVPRLDVESIADYLANHAPTIIEADYWGDPDYEKDRLGAEHVALTFLVARLAIEHKVVPDPRTDAELALTIEQAEAVVVAVKKARA